MPNSSSSSSSGIGFTGALTITFIILKLCKVITWSWIWVLSPLWIATAIYLFVILAIYIVYVSFKRYDNKNLKHTLRNNVNANEPKKRLGFQARMEEMMKQQKSKQTINPK
jgi:glucan phosphoethanolaminetransferase (alkaline phosphatase superfamily)